MEPIDLTSSDDEELYCHPKRTRTEDASDSDAEPVEALLPAAEPEASERHQSESDDPVITKQTGQVRNKCDTALYDEYTFIRASTACLHECRRASSSDLFARFTGLE